MNRKSLLAAVVGAAALGLAAVPAAGQMFERITITNSTGYTISEIYISPADTYAWEEDVMGKRELPDGDAVEIDFRRAENTCDWDLKVVYDDGEEAMWDGLDLCQNYGFQLFYNAGSGQTWLVTTD